MCNSVTAFQLVFPIDECECFVTISNLAYSKVLRWLPMDLCSERDTLYTKSEVDMSIFEKDEFLYKMFQNFLLIAIFGHMEKYITKIYSIQSIPSTYFTFMLP